MVVLLRAVLFDRLDDEIQVSLSNEAQELLLLSEGTRPHGKAQRAGRPLGLRAAVCNPMTEASPTITAGGMVCSGARLAGPTPAGHHLPTTSQAS